MILIIGTVRIAEDGLDFARSAMKRMIDASRAEAGCICYSYALDVLDPTLVHVIEVWADRATLEAHFRTPHLAEWRAQWDDFGITDRDLRLYETDEGTPI